jgi:thermosome
MSIRVFGKEYLRARDKNAQRVTIAVAKIILEWIKTTLGPKGMNKLIVDPFGEIAATNDGATMLKMLFIHHPVAKVLCEAAKMQDELVGDGTKTLVMIITGMLKMAEGLIEQKIHPNVIITGYGNALNVALTRLKAVSRHADVTDRGLLRRISLTTLNSKISGEACCRLADLITDAVLLVIEKQNGKYLLDRENIQIVKKHGGSLMESRLIKGGVIDKEIVHRAMPKSVKNAKIAIINKPLKIEVIKEYKREITIKDPSKIKQFLDEEDRIRRKMVEKLVNLGVNVVFCRRNIDKVVQLLLVDAGIMAIRRLLKDDYMKILTKATGAKVVADLDDLSEEDLGEAELVEEREMGGERIVLIEGCKNPKMVCILLRGGLDRQLDEAERAVKDAIISISTIVENPSYVPGGGATEEELAMAIREKATSNPGKEQLAMLAFADALELLPKSLAQNAGLDPIQVLTELRMQHRQGRTNYGINLCTGKVEEMTQFGIVEPIKVKEQALKSGFEVATALLRIDTITDKRHSTSMSKPPPQPARMRDLRPKRR